MHPHQHHHQHHHCGHHHQQQHQCSHSHNHQEDSHTHSCTNQQLHEQQPVLSVSQINSQSFDQMASGWDSNKNKSQFSLNVANGIIQVYETVVVNNNNSASGNTNNNSDKLKVMDFGAGTGTLTLMFLNQFNEQIERLDAIDVSQGMLSQLKDKINKLNNNNTIGDDDKKKNNYEKINIYNIDLGAESDDSNDGGEAVRLNRGKYNVIMSGMVFHHLADLPEKMKLLASYLAPGGVLIFVDIDKDEEHSDKFHCKHMGDAVQYKGGFSEKDLKVWLNQAGLINEQFFRNVPSTKKGNDDIERQFTLMTTIACKPTTTTN